jgi:hypothetical protein
MEPVASLTFTLRTETVKLLEVISKKEDRKKSNMVDFLICAYAEVLDCYYCHARDNCPVKNLNNKNNRMNKVK